MELIYGKRSIRRDMNFKRCKFCQQKCQISELRKHERNCKRMTECFVPVPVETRKHKLIVKLRKKTSKEQLRKKTNKEQLEKKRNKEETTQIKKKNESPVEQQRKGKSRHRHFTCLYCLKKFRSDYFPKHFAICKSFKKVKACPNRRCMFCINKKN